MTQVRPWTPEDKSMLCDLIQQGVTHAGISKQLGRTQRSVSKLASILGAKSPNDRGKWPDERHDEFLRLIQSGNTVYEIAEAMGITVMMVKNRTRYHQLKASPKLRVPSLTVEVKSRILNLHGQQWGVKYIAKETGISDARIRKYLREMGIKEFHYERGGKTVTHRKWTPEEELTLLNMQESDSTRAIAKRLNRSVSEVQNHAAQKGMALSQGRLTIKDFAEEVGITKEGMSRRIKSLGIISRTKKGDTYHTRGLSPFECMKVLSDLLKNPGMFSFSNKRVKELLNYYQDLRDAGRVKEE
jgi:DNA-binding CsgD family transcriptional regulator